MRAPAGGAHCSWRLSTPRPTSRPSTSPIPASRPSSAAPPFRPGSGQTTSRSWATCSVTRQAKTPSGQPAGVEFFDIEDPTRPRSVGFFDASGQHSVGTHFVWLAADGHAYLATQADDHAPRDPRDAFMLGILDVSDPSGPGRWAAGGQRAWRQRMPQRPRYVPRSDSPPVGVSPSRTSNGRPAASMSTGSPRGTPASECTTRRCCPSGQTAPLSPAPPAGLTSSTSLTAPGPP